MLRRRPGVGVAAGGAEDWDTLAPELLWPLWGVALGAGLAWSYRRLGRCRRCGRGAGDAAGSGD
jgi:hypothetical protein